MLQYFRGVLERHQTCAFSKFHSGVQTRRKAQLSATMPSSNSKPEMSICIHMLLCHMLLCNMMKHISFVPRGSQFETYRLWDLRTVMRCACRFFMPLSVSGSHIERTRSGHRMRRMSRSTWHVRRIIGHGLWFLSRRGHSIGCRLSRQATCPVQHHWILVLLNRKTLRWTFNTPSFVDVAELAEVLDLLGPDEMLKQKPWTKNWQWLCPICSFEWRVPHDLSSVNGNF